MITATLTDQSTQTDRMESLKLPETRGPLSSLAPPVLDSERQPELEVPATLERGDEQFEKTFHTCFNRAALGNAAQTLNKKFQHGRSVSMEQVRRIVTRFYPDQYSHEELKAAMQSMADSGLCCTAGGKLKMQSHYGKKA